MSPLMEGAHLWPTRQMLGGKPVVSFTVHLPGTPFSKALPGQGAHLGLREVWDSRLGGVGILGWDSGFIHQLTSTDEASWRLELGTCLVRDCGPGLKGGAPQGSLRAISRHLTRAACSTSLGNRTFIH